MPDAVARPASSPGRLVDPYGAYNFKLLIGNATGGHFTEVSGLGVKVERSYYREHGNNSTERPIPGRATYSPVKLRYGLTDSMEAWSWLLAAVNGDTANLRKQVSIVMLDSTGSRDTVRWDLSNAWPCEWHGAELDAMSHWMAMETLVIVHDGIARQRVGGNGSAA